MEDRDFLKEYKREFDSIHASDELKSAVKNLKPQKPRHVITPFKAVIGTVAAAFMIFAAVHEYSFETNTSGVISETVVSTQLPEAQFEIIEKKPQTEQTEEKKTEPTQVQKAENAVSVATSKPTQKAISTPVPTAIPTEDTNVAVSNVEVSSYNLGGRSMPVYEKWTVPQYYEYLGVNVAEKLGAKYVGTDTIEFETDSDGLPIDDTAVLMFLTNNGGSIRVTVSKHSLFDTSLSGTVTEAGNGLNGYKAGGGVYYNIYASGVTQDELVTIINNL